MFNFNLIISYLCNKKIVNKKNVQINNNNIANFYYPYIFLIFI